MARNENNCLAFSGIELVGIVWLRHSCSKDDVTFSVGHTNMDLASCSSTTTFLPVRAGFLSITLQACSLLSYSPRPEKTSFAKDKMGIHISDRPCDDPAWLVRENRWPVLTGADGRVRCPTRSHALNNSAVCCGITDLWLLYSFPEVQRGLPG